MPPQEPQNLPTPAQDQTVQPGQPQNLTPPTEPGGPAPLEAPQQPPAEPAPAAPQPQQQQPQQQAQPQPQSQPQPDQPSQPVAPPPGSTPQQGETAPSPAQSPNEQARSDAEEAKEELRDAIQQSNEVLATASTVFPISLFPDIYTVDRTKVTVMKKSLFGTSQVLSMRIEDVLNASVTAGMLFGRLQLTNRIIANDQNPYSIGPFWRKDVLRLKRVTQGYVIAMQKGIDVNSLSANELAHMLERLGEDDHPATNTGESED